MVNEIARLMSNLEGPKEIYGGSLTCDIVRGTSVNECDTGTRDKQKFVKAHTESSHAANYKGESDYEYSRSPDTSGNYTMGLLSPRA